MQYIAMDVHKQYTQVDVQKPSGERVFEGRFRHRRGSVKNFLARFEQGNPVALETVGNWYWLVDEIEDAGFEPRLVHAGKAKLLMGLANKTDKLDARGLNALQRNQSLPTVWIPPAELRDRRELPRTRMSLTSIRTRVKNRIHATLAKYGLPGPEASDIFSAGARRELLTQIEMLPKHTQFVAEKMLVLVDDLGGQIKDLDKQIKDRYGHTERRDLLQSLPGVGFVLAVVIDTEIGSIERFAHAQRLASYCGTTPSVHSSGGKTRYGRLRRDVNHYLKYAFVEAANAISRNRNRPTWRSRHAIRLYERIRSKKCHGTAVGAVARHLAEATYWMLMRNESYREPKKNKKTRSPISSTGR